MSTQARAQLARLYGEAVAEQAFGPRPDGWPTTGQWQLEDLHRPGGRGAAQAAHRAGDRSARQALAEFDAACRDLPATHPQYREDIP